MDFPEKRNLDGIYLRAEIDGKFESRCLTDLPWEFVEDWMRSRLMGNPDVAFQAAKHLHERFRHIGDELDVIVGDKDAEAAP